MPNRLLIAHRSAQKVARIAAKVAAHEMASHLLAVNLYPLGVMRGREQRVDAHPIHAPNSRPILLVHGVVHNPSAFFRLKKFLLRKGFKNIFTVNYSTRHGSLTNSPARMKLILWRTLWEE